MIKPPMLECGLVVRATKSDGDRLALVVYQTRSEEHPEPRWVIICDGEEFIATPRSIVDPDPKCSTCNEGKWWWTDDYEIRCANCIPPRPDWDKAWRFIAELLEGRYNDKVSQNGLDHVVTKLDDAFVQQDWPMFQRCQFVIHTSLRLSGQDTDNE